MNTNTISHLIDDLVGWRDTVLKELDKKQADERDLLLDLLQEGDSEDFRDEARQMSVDERNKRVAALREKRDQLDLSVKGIKTLTIDHIAFKTIAMHFGR